jgi:DNA-binding transcriptional MerR regulator
MKKGDDALWTIDELTGRVAEALCEHGYAGVASGRVRDVPDLRTIRYYTTLGLLDRPSAMRGRTGLYGRRHLVQLVAIKRLQAQGLSLVQVQDRLVGLSDAALQTLLGGESAPAPAAKTASPRASPARAEAFWRASAAPDPDQGSSRESPGSERVALEEGLTLSLEARRELDDDDLRVIRMAAAPLIEILRLRGLIGVGPAEPRKGKPR